MEDLRVLIADDDAGMRAVMRKIVERVDGFTLAGEADNGKDALALAEKERPAVVFLDVEMPEINGVECARAIQDMDPNTVIIFATAHEGYMGDAFEVYAFDYLMKPFKVERVIQTLERARERLLARQSNVVNPVRPRAVDGRMMLKHREGVTFLDLKDILLVQREERATVLYTADGERYVTGDSLADMEERLPAESFFRCHKSYIINLNHIKDITPYGRWTYVVRLEGTRHDALITHEKYEELERMFR
ncbi:MAG: LytTR family DNA-binding domain-containing protein [Clostridiales bacterium]|nr:LytTR family DNA-binding domain-containing protein [Clostridiales bacterium]